VSLWGRGRTRREFQGLTPQEYIVRARGIGPASRGAVYVDEESALRHSAVWACRRLRADLMASFPVDIYRDVVGIPAQQFKPPIFVSPGGKQWPYKHWMWATQHDLDGTGNAIGLITEVNGLGLPARIDLVPTRVCSVFKRKGDDEPRYKIDGKEYRAEKVWHERQFPAAGLPVGLSPIACAAWSISEYLSIQDFALNWFGGGAVPKARMKNVAKKLLPADVTTAKQWYRDTMKTGDLLVHGNDWEYDFIQAQQADAAWMNSRHAGVVDISRFFGVPADLIDAAVSGSAITYQTTLQRNLQFLIMHLGPAAYRREKALSKLLPAPRYVKLNTSALRWMDDQTRAQVIKTKIEARTLAPSEARELDNLPPFTEEQMVEFDRLFPKTQSANPVA